jgi:hypothetical protein
MDDAINAHMKQLFNVGLPKTPKQIFSRYIIRMGFPVDLLARNYSWGRSRLEEMFGENEIHHFLYQSLWQYSSLLGKAGFR